MSPSITAGQFLEAAAYRRTVYGLKGTSKVSDARVEEILKKVLDFAPSSYNTQPVRVTLVTGDQHKKLWETVINTGAPVIKAAAGEEVAKQLTGIWESHKASYGSVLFWERSNTTKEASETHKSIAHLFPQFGEHANAMNQILVWSALELEGVGANLQHVGGIPPIEAALKQLVGVPEDYTLKANLVYGDEPAEHPAKPAKLPTSETLKVLN